MWLDADAAPPGCRLATITASIDIAVAVDDAQYVDGAGPCLEALEAEYPAAVPDIAATMTWPRFRDTAAAEGLQSSLSVPLCADSGRIIEALNLYSRRRGSLTTLTTAVWADDPASETWSHATPDDSAGPDGRPHRRAGIAGEERQAIGIRFGS